jgi:hypothetical protein
MIRTIISTSKSHHVNTYHYSSINRSIYIRNDANKLIVSAILLSQSQLTVRFRSLLSTMSSQSLSRLVGFLGYPMFDYFLTNSYHFFLFYAMPACVLTHHFWLKQTVQTAKQELQLNNILQSSTAQHSISALLQHSACHEEPVYLCLPILSRANPILFTNDANNTRSIWQGYLKFNLGMDWADVAAANAQRIASNSVKFEQDTLLISPFHLADIKDVSKGSATTPRDLFSQLQYILALRRTRYRLSITLTTLFFLLTSLPLYEYLNTYYITPTQSRVKQVNQGDVNNSTNIESKYESFSLKAFILGKEHVLFSVVMAVVLATTGCLVYPSLIGSVKSQTRLFYSLLDHKLSNASLKPELLAIFASDKQTLYANAVNSLVSNNCAGKLTVYVSTLGNLIVSKTPPSNLLNKFRAQHTLTIRKPPNK